MTNERLSMQVGDDKVGFGYEGLALFEHLLASGGMLSAQLPTPSGWSPEKKLAGAVLASALIEVRDHHDEDAYRRRVSEDLDWITSDDWEWPYSFVRLCHVFDLRPEWVRDTVRRWLEQPVPRHRAAIVWHTAA